MNIPYENEFDIVVFKSVLGGIGSGSNKPAQGSAIREMHKSLKSGGELLFAENLTASPFHKFLRAKFVKWGTSWRYVSIDEMNEFLQPFNNFTYSTTGFSGAFGRNERQRDLLAAADKIFFNRLFPSHWKYIITGVARK